MSLRQKSCYVASNRQQASCVSLLNPGILGVHYQVLQWILLFMLSCSYSPIGYLSKFSQPPTGHTEFWCFCYYTLGIEITTSPCIGITWYGHGYRTHLKVGFLNQRVSEFMTVTPQGTRHSTPCSRFLSSTPGYLPTTCVLGERKAETLFPMLVPKTTLGTKIS